MSPRLLLVEDADDIRAIACLSLERIGNWTVVPAASGQAALEALAGDVPFDAVVLDVMMPGLDGPDTLARMREGALAPKVPVVFLTAKVGAGERERLLSLGAIGVIAKPFDPLTLPEELRRMLDR
ncbi:MAG TPA: response regulator [Solirubrobacteraceae bacterium]|jgi:CheY-like chemotaxis protein|nr:response regulator [Solirubrobacteraceae bacterium]